MTETKSNFSTLLNVNGQTKLTLQHRQRLACIYIRQSTLAQVERNRESQFNQYHLAERAAQLGWPTHLIRVIDTDQAHSGASALDRTGFKELVAEVSLGRVGIIFGYEVSRLARNNSDWYHLLDLAAVFGTLIADNDGIYDPRLFNDRLLLGLKGTMSEAELHLIRQRLDAGRLSQIRRGEYRQVLPTGLCRMADGRVVKDPDEQVRHTLELIFERFNQLGSCPKVVRALQKTQILIPRRQLRGLDRGQLLWKDTSIGAVYDIIRNPAYAGAFAFGRRAVAANPSDFNASRAKKGRMRRSSDDWGALHHNIYPAYISWEQFVNNQEQLQRSQTLFNKTPPDQVTGAARAGQALLQGLVVCGVCGYRLRVIYKARAKSKYYCTGKTRQLEGPRCTWVSGPAWKR